MNPTQGIEILVTRAERIADIQKQIAMVTATNKHDIYNSNLYWSQKGYNVIDILIEQLSGAGEVIFDPFMGSGVTVIEAVKNERKAIGCDINDIPIFIADTLLKKYDTVWLENKIHLFSNQMDELQAYYFTYCPACSSDQAVIHTVSFDQTGRNCHPKLKTVNYRCSCSAKLLTKKPDASDLDGFLRQYPYFWIKDQELVENTQLAAYKGQKVTDLFTNRNLKVIDEILGRIGAETDPRMVDALRYILLGILHLCKITDKKSNSQWPLWTPKHDCIEKNVVTLFKRKSKLFLKSIQTAEALLPVDRSRAQQFALLNNGSYLLHKKPVQHLTTNDIPDQSVDLIVTDPPYLGQVAYSEYMQLYQPFLQTQFNLQDEIVISSSPARDKSPADYFQLLNQAIGQSSRKLKTGRIFCMYFHDCGLKVWAKLMQMMACHQLRYISQVHVRKGKKTVKNILSPKKSLNGDALLFFVKDPTVKVTDYFADLSLPDFQSEHLVSLKLNIQLIGKEILLQKREKSAPTTELYDNGVMEYLIKTGYLAHLSQIHDDLIDIFQEAYRWDPDKAVWSLE